MRISVITITFNASNVLPATMRSLEEQTFRDFEHIIIDGASNDNTVALARSMATPNLRILSEKDKGIYDAMNKGLKMAKGDYLIFLNAGDIFANPTSLMDYATAIISRQVPPDIIYADTSIIDSEGKILRPRHLSAPSRLTFDSFSKGMLICHQAFMVRRSLAPLYDQQYSLSADYDWTIRCIKASDPDNCINLNKVEILYLDNGATEKNKFTSLKERFRIMSSHYGLREAIIRHLSFIPRAIKRNIKKS